MAKRKYCLPVLLCLFIVFTQVCAVQSTLSIAQDTALAYIEDVLPIDSSKFNIELKVDGNMTDVPKELAPNISGGTNDRVLIYFLGSLVGTADSLDVIFVVSDNKFVEVSANIDNAPSYSTFGDPTKMEDVNDFLVKYQNWSGLDSAEMIEILSDADITQNCSLSSGNITMTIQHTDVSGDRMEIGWVNATNGAGIAFDASFHKGFPVNFYDERQISSTAAPLNPSPTAAIADSPNSLAQWGLTVAAITVAVAALATIAVMIKKGTQRYKRIQIHKGTKCQPKQTLPFA